VSTTETVLRSARRVRIGSACAGGSFENDTIYADEFQGIADAEIDAEAIQLTQRCGGLSLKQARRHGASSRKRLDRVHSLSELLGLAESRLRVLGATALEPVVRELIEEFDALDPHGQTFRYSLDSEGALTIAEQLRFDVVKIRAAVRDAMRELRRAQNWACITAQECREYLHDTAP